MVSNLGTRAAPDLERELALAYDGEVPPPYYWQVPVDRLHAPARHHPGEIDAALPYASLPSEFMLAPAVSFDQLDDLVERRARREEIG